MTRVNFIHQVFVEIQYDKSLSYVNLVFVKMPHVKNMSYMHYEWFELCEGQMNVLAPSQSESVVGLQVTQ